MLCKNQWICTPLLIGVVNLSKQSFSQDGVTTSMARQHRILQVLSYADGVDLGAESTGPTALKVSLSTELQNITSSLKQLPMILRKCQGTSSFNGTMATKKIISIDTRRPHVALKALEFGANMINDISGGRGTGEEVQDRHTGALNIEKRKTNMFRVLGAFPHSSLVLMYSPLQYGHCADPICETPSIENTIRFFKCQIKIALKNGMNKNQIILDPGMGRFLSKDVNVSTRVFLKGIPALQRAFLGYPLYVGASRKGFLDALAQRSMKPHERAAATLATLAVCQDLNVEYIRTHDVEWARDFINVRNALTSKKK